LLAQFIRFAITGFINTAIDFGLFNLLVLLSGARSTLAIALINTAAVSLAVINSFFMNRSWTFPDHDRSPGQFRRFVIASVIGIAINSVTVSLLSTWSLLSAIAPLLVLNAAKACGALLSTAWNFLAYRIWVFRPASDSAEFMIEALHPDLVSIIIPAYNEERRLPGRLQQLAASLPAQGIFEIVVVDDGSTDGTGQVIRQFSREFPFIRQITLGRNQGKGAAVRTGMLAAGGAYLLFTDADNTFTPEHIMLVTEKLRTGLPAVIACRPSRTGQRLAGEPRWRKWQGRCFNLLVRSLLLPGVKDSQCGLKGFSRSAAAALFPRQRIGGFAFDVELLAFLQALQFPLTILEVKGEDCPGSTVRRLLTPAQMAVDVIKIKLYLFLNLYQLPRQNTAGRNWAYAALLFTLAMLVRIPWLWEVPRYVDELKEVQLAYQIYQGHALPLHNAAHDIGALHNYILAGIFKLLGAGIYWPRLYVAATSALTVVLIYLIGKKLYGHRAGLVASLLLLSNGMHILVTHMAWSNCTTPFFFCLAVFALLQAEEKSSGRWLVISAVLWALTLQTHSSVIIYLLAVLAYVLRPSFRQQTGFKWKVWLSAGICFLLFYINMIYYNLVSKGGSFSWLMHKGYALEKEPGFISYLQNLQQMMIELLRAVSSTYPAEDSFLVYLSHPGFSFALLFLLAGIRQTIKRKKTLPLFIMAGAFLMMPWINERYVFYLATRYIMPVLLCTVLLVSLAITESFAWISRQLGHRQALNAPAVIVLAAAVLLQLVPYYSYCWQKSDTNLSNRLALQVFEKTMELSDQRSTLVILDDSIGLENDPLPYLLTLARQPYEISHADTTAFANVQVYHRENHSAAGSPRRIIGIMSAGSFQRLQASMPVRSFQSYSCRLIMPASARGERIIYVLDLSTLSKTNEIP